MCVACLKNASRGSDKKIYVIMFSKAEEKVEHNLIMIKKSEEKRTDEDEEYDRQERKINSKPSSKYKNFSPNTFGLCYPSFVILCIQRI